MKILRILTGTHAGIRARLTPGRYRIGKADDTDICITDWDDEEILVELDEQGTVSARRAQADASDQSVIQIPDFVACPFGTTVLCFGGEDDVWPPDIELLASMYHGDADTQGDLSGGTNTLVRRRPHAAHAVLAAIMVGALLVAAGSVVASVWSAHGQATPPRDAREVASQLTQQLRDAHIAGLRARAQGDTVVVDGMVDTTAQNIAVRALLEHMRYHAIARQYDVAHDDAASIEESIGIDGVHVRYAGDGVFDITGVAPSIPRLETALNWLRADLTANIRRIDVDVMEAPAASAVMYSAMLNVGATRYVQTTDGVKHVFTAGTSEFGGGPPILHESIVPDPGAIH